MARRFATWLTLVTLCISTPSWAAPSATLRGGQPQEASDAKPAAAPTGLEERDSNQPVLNLLKESLSPRGVALGPQDRREVFAGAVREYAEAVVRKAWGQLKYARAVRGDLSEGARYGDTPTERIGTTKRLLNEAQQQLEAARVLLVSPSRALGSSETALEALKAVELQPYPPGSLPEGWSSETVRQALEHAVRAAFAAGLEEQGIRTLLVGDLVPGAIGDTMSPSLSRMTASARAWGKSRDVWVFSTRNLHEFQMAWATTSPDAVVMTAALAGRLAAHEVTSANLPVAIIGAQAGYILSRLQGSGNTVFYGTAEDGLEFHALLNRLNDAARRRAPGLMEGSAVPKAAGLEEGREVLQRFVEALGPAVQWPAVVEQDPALWGQLKRFLASGDRLEEIRSEFRINHDRGVRLINTSASLWGLQLAPGVRVGDPWQLEVPAAGPRVYGAYEALAQALQRAASEQAITRFWINADGVYYETARHTTGALDVPRPSGLVELLTDRGQEVMLDIKGDNSWEAWREIGEVLDPRNLRVVMAPTNPAGATDLHTVGFLRVPSRLQAFVHLVGYPAGPDRGSPAPRPRFVIESTTMARLKVWEHRVYGSTSTTAGLEESNLRKAIAAGSLHCFDFYENISMALVNASLGDGTTEFTMNPYSTGKYIQHLLTLSTPEGRAAAGSLLAIGDDQAAWAAFKQSVGGRRDAVGAALRAALEPSPGVTPETEQTLARTVMAAMLDDVKLVLRLRDQTLRENGTGETFYWAVSKEFARRIAAALQPIYDRTKASDRPTGFVSIEVDPRIERPEFANRQGASLTDLSTWMETQMRLQARDLAMIAPNILVKVPSTPAGYATIAAVPAHYNTTVEFVPAHITGAIAAYERRPGHEAWELRNSPFVSRNAVYFEEFWGPGLVEGDVHTATLINAHDMFKALGPYAKGAINSSLGMKVPGDPGELYAQFLVGFGILNTPPDTARAFNRARDLVIERKFGVKSLEQIIADYFDLVKAGRIPSAAKKFSAFVNDPNASSLEQARKAIAEYRRLAGRPVDAARLGAAEQRIGELETKVGKPRPFTREGVQKARALVEAGQAVTETDLMGLILQAEGEDKFIGPFQGAIDQLQRVLDQSRGAPTAGLEEGLAEPVRVDFSRVYATKAAEGALVQTLARIGARPGQVLRPPQDLSAVPARSLVAYDGDDPTNAGIARVEFRVPVARWDVAVQTFETADAFFLWYLQALGQPVSAIREIRWSADGRTAEVFA